MTEEKVNILLVDDHIENLVALEAVLERLKNRHGVQWLVELTAALHGLAHNEELRRHYLADAAAYAGRFQLTPQQHAALVGLDTAALVAMGTHPLVAFLANMQIERQRRG